MHKLLVIGCSCSGKSTLATFLKEKYQIQVSEIDDVLKESNGGTYPLDRAYKDTVLIPKIIQEVLRRDKTIFFTNALYFSIEDLLEARKKGFTIIQLIAPRDILEKRNQYRMQHEGYEDHSQWLDEMGVYQKEIFDKGLVDAVIDTKRPVDKVAEEFTKVFHSR